MSSNDIVAYKAAHTGLSIRQMSTKEQGITTAGILLTVAVISGCPLPTDGRHLKILESEFIKFLFENNSFSQLTYDEIITAFRFNSAGQLEEKVKHYQNMFNLDYLGEVLNQWVKYKRNLQEKVRRELTIKNILFFDPAAGDTEIEIIEFSKNKWESTSDYMQIESRVYDILCKQGKIDLYTENKNRIFSLANAKMMGIYREFQGLYIQIEQYRPDQIVAGKIAVAEYFNNGLFVSNDTEPRSQGSNT